MDIPNSLVPPLNSIVVFNSSDELITNISEIMSTCFIFYPFESVLPMTNPNMTSHESVGVIIPSVAILILKTQMACYDHVMLIDGALVRIIDMV